MRARHSFLRLIVPALCLLPLFASAQDSLTLQIRYRPAPGSTIARAFVPGSFNNWGPNNNGIIATNAPSIMTWVDSLQQYVYPVRLRVGNTYEYKIHVHNNASGSSYAWFSDPLNPDRNTSNNDNSVLTLTDPLLFQPAHEQDASGNIVAIAAGLYHTEAFTSITLTLNGTPTDALPYYNSATGILYYKPEQPIDQSLEYRIEATGSEGQVVSYEAFVPLNVAVTKEARPSGLEDGITYYQGDPTRVTLSLFAPRKKFVYVVGDFNDWKLDPAYLMKQDSLKADSVWYWITLDGLTANQEYGFQYLVDGTLRIADPYTEKVLDPWNDVYISSETYPGLKPYPAGKTEEPVSILHPGRPDFAWEALDYTPPARKDLVVYELLVRDFLAKHDFKTVADTLGYLKRLGINAIELMPVNEFEGNLSWGYNPAFYFAPDKYYGPADRLKELVQEAHRQDMAIIVDQVLNHSYGQHPLVRLWATSPGNPSSVNPYYNTSCPHPPYCWGADFNHARQATKYFVDRVNSYWLTEYDVDGFRFDFTKGFTNVNSQSSYDAARIAILKRMADEIWEVNPDAYVILEHLTDNPEEKVLADYGMMLWANLNGPYNEATMGYNQPGKSDFSWGFYGQRGWTNPHLVTYMESHDEERLMYKNGQYGNSSGDYNIKQLPVSLDRMKLAGAFFFTLPGPKMIWQFGELGYDYSIEFNGRVGDKPIRWDYYADPLRLKLYKTWQALLRLRHENETFTSTETVVTQNVAGAVKTLKLAHPDMDAVVVGNFDVVAHEVDPGFTKVGRWYRFFEGDSLEVVDVNAPVQLEPGMFYVYTTRRQAAPEDGLITVDAEEADGAPALELKLDPVYPNPARTETTLAFTLPMRSTIRLEVYDLLGRRVGVAANGTFAAGSYHQRFDVAPLAAGAYFVRLFADKKVRTQTMAVVK